MKYLIFTLLFLNPLFAFDFSPIKVTDSDVFNYFFSFPIYTMFVALPFIAVLSLFKKI